MAVTVQKKPSGKKIIGVGAEPGTTQPAPTTGAKTTKGYVKKEPINDDPSLPVDKEVEVGFEPILTGPAQYPEVWFEAGTTIPTMKFGGIRLTVGLRMPAAGNEMHDIQQAFETAREWVDERMGELTKDITPHHG